MITCWFICFIIGLIFVRHWWFWSPVDTTDFYLENSPLIIAHRGLLVNAPENTLSSYRSALEHGFTALEMDVVPTSDGKIICSHNFDLERESDGFGWIDETTFEELQKVNTGNYSHPNQVCGFDLLVDVSTALPKNIIINIEIKSFGAFHLRHAITVARLIRTGRIKQKVIVSSFNPFVIWIIKWFAKKTPTALILESLDYLWSVNLVHPDFLHPDAALVDDHFLQLARTKNLPVNVWTVNNAPAMQWLITQGAQGIITDNPNGALIFHAA